MISVKSFTFSPVQENTYILYNQNRHALIIDPGCYFAAEQETLKNFLITNNLKPVQLLNTHCHLDHVFGNKWIHKEYGLELFIHPNEEIVLSFAPDSGIRYGLPFENYNGPLHFLHENDLIHFDDDILKVIAAPGHSPGSICFYCEAQNFIIGGDVLFRESIGRVDLPGGDHATLLKNIREKLFILPAETIVYPGHGMPTKIGYEKENNPFLH
ncbi:MAG TPA: MBL fold metallo-hydrolase [Chitinophagaceae bacterium]|nr:MBL fold metallo-hydrolase [Chitinophagaceae bacterium]